MLCAGSSLAAGCSNGCGCPRVCCCPDEVPAILELARVCGGLASVLPGTLAVADTARGAWAVLISTGLGSLFPTTVDRRFVLVLGCWIMGSFSRSSGLRSDRPFGGGYVAGCAVAGRFALVVPPPPLPPLPRSGLLSVVGSEPGRSDRSPGLLSLRTLVRSPGVLSPAAAASLSSLAFSSWALLRFST